MEHLAPIGDVYQAGTLSGNPLATAAGLAVLGELDDSSYTMLEGRAAEVAPLLESVVRDAGLPLCVPRVGPLLGLHFTETPPTNYDEVTAGVGNGLYRRFFRAMLDRGVALAPGPYEAAFPSLAHTKDDLERTVDLASAAAAEVVASA
jgi:glutamate-1-semialdehyde 2,1-aminomutase